MMTMLMLSLSAGLALGLVANVFRLLALSVAFALICVLGAIRLGAPHPVAATLACLFVLQIGYAAGLCLLAQSPRSIASIEQKRLRPRRR